EFERSGVKRRWCCRNDKKLAALRQRREIFNARPRLRVNNDVLVIASLHGAFISVHNLERHLAGAVPCSRRAVQIAVYQESWRKPLKISSNVDGSGGLTNPSLIAGDSYKHSAPY